MARTSARRSGHHVHRGLAGFAACTGSSMASAATMTQVAWPEMKKRNYRPSFALGTIAAGGTLGILIPPSIPFIIYRHHHTTVRGEAFHVRGYPRYCAYPDVYGDNLHPRQNQSFHCASCALRTWRERLVSMKNIVPGGTLALIILGSIWEICLLLPRLAGPGHLRRSLLVSQSELLHGRGSRGS